MLSVRSLFFAVVAALSMLALAGARLEHAEATPTELFFSEYVEGSSFNKAVEIYNGTGAPVTLGGVGGYQVRSYHNGAATANTTVTLAGTIASGDVFVLAHESADPAVRARADQETNVNWFNGNDAVALGKGSPFTIVDVIGQIGPPDPGAGGWGTDPTNTTDNTIRRKSGIEAGDTNPSDPFDPAVQWDGFANNTFDGLGFHVSGGDAPPFVSSTSPAAGASGIALNASVSITFSEDVSVTEPWYSISCSTSGAHAAAASGGPQTFTLDPAADFAQGETCTVTITGSQVADADPDDPPNTMAGNHTFSFATFAPPPEIAEIQGAAHISPKNGQDVTGVEGIVIARRAPQTASGTRGIWIQDPTPDANNATSDAIFVFTGSNAAATPLAQVGDAVSVNGRVSEFRGGNDPDNLTITQITSSNANIAIGSSGNALPGATVIGSGGRLPPTEVIDDDNAGNVETGGVFDPDGDAIDFYESLESMRVQVNGGAVVGATRSFGEITLLPDGGTWATGLRTLREGILLGGYADPNPERIIVDDEILRDLAPAPRPTKSMPDMNVGDDLTSAVVGPLDYTFSNFKIQATTTPTFASGGLTREITATPRRNEVAFATFNVENLAGNDPQTKYDHLAGLIVNNLHSPDVLGIEEVQDNDGVTGGTTSPVVDASVSWGRLITAIQTAGGPLYQHRQIDPVDDAEGGAPGGNIRVGFLFRTDRGVTFVDRPGGSPTTETTVVGRRNRPQLSSSPGRIGTQSEAFVDTRKSLVAEFRVRAKTVFAIVNHFSSKTDDQPLFGPNQPPTRFSEEFRHGQAQVVNDFVDAILAKDRKAKIVVLGDINDFEFSETTSILEGGVLTSLMDTLPPRERYSYVFEGNSQTLDQILLSNRGLLRRSHRPVYDVVHLNAEFADAIQASDHDPSIVRLKFGDDDDDDDHDDGDDDDEDDDDDDDDD